VSNIERKGSHIGGISFCFGGPGQKDLGAGKMLQIAVFVWNKRFVFCGCEGNFGKFFAGV